MANTTANTQHAIDQKPVMLLRLALQFELYRSSQGNPVYRERLNQQLKAMSKAMAEPTTASELEPHWLQIAIYLNSAIASLHHGGFLEPGKHQQYQQAVHHLWLQLNPQPKILEQDAALPLNARAQLQQLYLLILRYSLNYLDPGYGYLLEKNANNSMVTLDLISDQLFHLQHQYYPDLQASVQHWQLLQSQLKMPQSKPIYFMMSRFALEFGRQYDALIQRP